MLQTLHLSHGYDNHTVLNDLNITIEDGGFYAVMGANGCGKTTLLHCLGGLIRPNQGHVTIAGTDIAALSTRQRAKQIALVCQQQYDDFDFTAYDIVMMARNAYQRRLSHESVADRAIVEQAMRDTATWHLRDRVPRTMSGGERQRTMIARALAQQTPTILLDEPLSNLDIAHQIEIMELLTAINQQEHKTILIVLHDLPMAYHYCPSLLLIDHGSADYIGPMREGLTTQRIERVFGVSTTINESKLTLTYK
ncbi:MAG: ABC transporter ATP-binding protein [Bacteroidales bacterium]|nr:ABC transporter ATP-binding protein [Bacteroidales bacterium]